jgi:hypothetical protein
VPLVLPGDAEALPRPDDGLLLCGIAPAEAPLMRLLHTTRVGTCAVKIYTNPIYHEYVVKTIQAGRKQGEYFTDDKQDARNTAAAQARWLKKRRSCR